MYEFIATNEKELQDIVKAVNYNGSGRIIIDGIIKVSKSIKFTSPIHLRGTPGSKLLMSKDGGTFTWQGSQSKPYSFRANKPFAESFKTDAPIKRGSWVLMSSDDSIDVPPHHPTGKQFPMELHQINHVSANESYVNDFIVDRMVTNAELIISEPLQDIVVENLTVELDGTPQNRYDIAFRFNNCNNVLMENVRFEREGPGGIWAHNSSNINFRGVHIEGTQAADIVYGFITGTVNGMIICDSNISGTRHTFTTTSGKSNGKNRYGTPLNVKVSNCIINVPTKAETNKSRIGLDTHAEGWGVVFDNCIVNVGPENTNVGAQTRSRNTVFKDLIIRGGKLSKGIRVLGPDGIIQNCTIDNAWYAIEATQDRAMIVGNVLRNTTSAPIWLKSGDNHTVKNNVFYNCSYRPSSKLRAPFVQEGPGKGNKIDI